MKIIVTHDLFANIPNPMQAGQIAYATDINKYYGSDGISNFAFTTLGLANPLIINDLNVNNQDLNFVKLLTLNSEIDGWNSGVPQLINWKLGAAHKITLTQNVTLTFEGYGKDIVPAMTSNITPSGVASASDHIDAFDAWKVFDNILEGYTSSWVVYAAPWPAWIQYQFPIAKTILVYSLLTPSVTFAPGSFPRNWTLQGSNNGTDWTILATVTNGFSAGENLTKKYFSVTNPDSYTYYRLNVTFNISNAGYLDLQEMELIETDFNDPCFLTLKLIQDATGSRTVTWPETVKGTITVAAAANAVTIIQFYFDGTYYWPMSVAAF